MGLRWHSKKFVGFWLAAIVVASSVSLFGTKIVAAEEPGAGYVADPEVEKLIAAALDADKAVAFPAQKRLSELGGAAERALNNKLYTEKVQQTRRSYADLIARCCAGRVGYRVTLELMPDGSGKIILESDRTMLLECADKFDRLNNKTPDQYSPDELRRNPYSKVDLAKHISGNMTYNQGSTVDVNGRVMASGELAFTNFDDFAAFASSFDKLGYHMLNGIALSDNNGVRTLRFKKNAEADRIRAATYLMLFHDVKWEFILDYKGPVKTANTGHMDGNRRVWRFNCSQMLSGEAEIEATFDPHTATERTAQATPPSTPSDPPAPNAQTPLPNGIPTAILATKLLRVAVGKAYNRDAGEPNPNGPETIAVLDGRPSTPSGPDLKFQWTQTSGTSLNLQKSQLAKSMIKIVFYQVGRYTFDLTVTQNGQTSDPVEMTVLVSETVPDFAAAPPGTGENGNAGAAPNGSKDDGSAAVTKTVVMPFKKGDPPNREDKKPDLANLNTNVPPQPTPAKQPTQEPQVVKTEPKRDPEVSIPSEGLAINEIRREEAEYNKRRFGTTKVGTQPETANATPPEPRKEVVQITPPLPPVPPAPVKQAEPPAPPPINLVADKQGAEVPTSGRVELDEIRKQEAEYKRTHSASKESVKVPPPDVGSKEPIKVPPPDVGSKETIKVPSPDVGSKEPIKVPPPDAGSKEPIKVPPPDVASKETIKVTPSPTVDTHLDLTPKTDKKEPENKDVAEAKKEPPAVPLAAGGDPLQRGIQLMKSGQFMQAIDALKAAEKANPTDVPTKLNLAIAMFEASEKPDGYDRAMTQLALEKFNEIAGIKEDIAAVFMYAGHCNARLDRDQDKSMYYKKGYSVDNKVFWEVRWVMGNKYLKAQDFTSALSHLTGAEAAANKDGIKDPRLLRDLAFAYHGAKKDDEAIQRVNALWEIGYLPDRQLVAELKKTAPDAVKVPDSAYAQGGTAAVALIPNPDKPVEKQPDSGSKEVAVNEPKVSPSETTGAKAVVPAPIGTDPKEAKVPQPTVPPITTQGATATNAEPKVAEKSAEPAKKGQTLDGLNKLTADDIKPSPRPTPPPRVKLEPQPVAPHRVAKPIPPIPTSFEGALAAGKNALARGRSLIEKNPAAAKAEALDCWDESEAMLRAAWNIKPGDTDVTVQLEELAKQVGVIALVKNQSLISKPNGLVVLNAEPSLVYPKDYTIYYAWEQVAGPDLGIRREDLVNKLVGLKIKVPGVYKFELVVSDGTRGGNPVTVTVEVR